MAMLRVFAVFCFVLGVICLGVCVVGLADSWSHVGETETIGRGEFAFDMPKTTVFQEIGLLLYGVFGTTLILVSFACAMLVQADQAHQQRFKHLEESRDARRRLCELATQQLHALWELQSPTSPTPRPVGDIANGTPKKLKVRCGGCGKVVSGGADWRGRLAACPQCKSPIQFPA